MASHSESSNKSKLIWIILLVIFALLFIASAIVLAVKLWPQDKSENDKYKNNVSSTAQEVLPENPINFELLKSENSDICAWIKIDDTVIDYPIFMSGKDKKEDFYIDHDKDGKPRSCGALYIQRLNSEKFTDPNTMIYGHNMLNGSMFGTLKKYRNRTYFDEHSTLYIYKPKAILEYKIVSAFLYDDRHILNSFPFGTKEGRKQYFDLYTNPSTLVKNVLENQTFDDNDKLVTLSTCGSGDRERYLVVAKLIKTTKTK